MPGMRWVWHLASVVQSDVVDGDPSPRNRRPRPPWSKAKDIWEDQKAGGPKILIAEDAKGTKQLAGQTIYDSSLIY